MRTQKRWYKIAVYCLFTILLAVTNPITASTFSGTVIDSKTNEPIPHVRVSIGYTDTVTYTDDKGNFSFEHISGVKRGNVIRAAKQKLAFIKKISHGSVIDLRNCQSVNTIKLFNLSGKCLFKADLPKSSSIVPLPDISNGLYIVQLIAENTITYSFTWNSLNVSQLVKIASFYGGKQLSAAVQSSNKVVFQNDFYYPLTIDEGSSPQTIMMKPDPRGVVFDQSKINRYDFVMTTADSTLMEKKALLENYVPAQFSYNNVPYGKVGLRYKGSSYSLPNCFESDGTRKIKPECSKISFKVSFDEYNDSLRFYKMKKLNLHSESIDPTKMHDILSYELFREMGIIAPRCAFAKVYINGVFQGIFCAVEDIDGRFTDARWQNDPDGNLYKEKWPISSSPSYYLNGLVTNDKREDSADVSKMVQFYKAISASDESNFKSQVSPFWDFDYWLHYIAVDRVIHNSDGVMTWYVKPGWQSNHNYFIYQPDSTNEKLWIIPWDLHVTFSKKDPIIDALGVPEWNVKPATCDTIKIWGDQDGLPANCDKLIGLTASVFWNDFVKISEKMLSGYFDIKYLQNKIDFYKNLIDPVIKEDPHVEYASWVGQVNGLRNDIVSLNNDFDDYIHQRTVKNDTTDYLKPFNGTGYLVTDQLNNFEFPYTGNEKNWSSTMCATGSSISVKHDTVNPLWGKSDFLYSFVYNPVPGDGMYQEWGRINIRFKTPVDLTALKEIQVNLKSDSNRDFFLFIASSAYQENSVKTEYGWWESTAPKDSLRVFKVNTMGYPSWATGNLPEIKDQVLKDVTAIGFQSNPHFGANGKLAVVPDSGYLRIDNIRFVF